MLERNQSGGLGVSPKILIAVVLAGMALSRYYCNSSFNDITGESQHISISPDQEVAMGLQSAPQMIQEMGGEVKGTQFDERVVDIMLRLYHQGEFDDVREIRVPEPVFPAETPRPSHQFIS